MTITQIGRHRVQLGDVTKGIDRLMEGEKAAIVYSDPPWGDGNVKFWATKNKKDTGREIVPSTNDELLKAVCGAAASYGAELLFVEHGLRWAAEVEAHGRAAGFSSHTRIDIRYNGGRKFYPMHLHVFTRVAGLPAGYVESVTGTHGYETLKRALSPFAPQRAGQILLDPCCGMGYSARAAIEFGMVFRGNELNEVRLEKTKRRLTRAQTT